MPEEMKSRVLTKTLGSMAAQVVASDNVTVLGSEGWNVSTFTVGAADYAVIYNIQSWDLSGYTREDLTLFPQGILMQDMGPQPRGITQANAQRATLVSTTPINVNDLLNVETWGAWSLPGSPGSTHNLNNILQGRLQYYLTLTTYAGLQQVSESTWGSGDATAGEKIWLCDAYLIPATDGSGIAAPDQAFVMPSIIGKEPELEYMMRLSRSLEPIY